MFVAKSENLHRIFLGLNLHPKQSDSQHTTIGQQFSCPVCGKAVSYNDSTINHPFEYFAHDDGSPDCFEDKSISDGHRIAVEVTVKALYNRIREVTGEPVDINIEKWIGTRSDFVVADIRITDPLRIAAEIYYKTERLALGRRLDTIFSNEYRVYLIFHTNGKHNADRVERYLQQIAPLRVGRYKPETFEITLGDLFTGNQLDLSQSNRELLPNYIAR